MNRFCANCGTEVDETAVFCPTCGQPIDQDVESELPPAPAWPEPEPPAIRAGYAEVYEPEAEDLRVRQRPGLEEDLTATREPEPVVREVEPVHPEPRPTHVDSEPAYGEREPVRAEHAAAVEEFRRVDRAREPVAPRPRPAPAAPASGPMRAGAAAAASNLVTTPVTLSGWLIGGGAAFGALGTLVMLFDGFAAPVELVVLVGLLLVAVTVFFAASIPAIPNLRLATLAIVLVAAGVALDRIGLSGAGVGELLLFLGAAAAAIGAVLLELGRDQPLGISPS